jgi:hypothetical protein
METLRMETSPVSVPSQLPYVGIYIIIANALFLYVSLKIDQDNWKILVK